MEDASPRSMTSSGVSPVYTLNRVQQLHRSSRGVPQINLKALIEQNEEVESREVTPRIPAQEEQEEPSREALNRIQVIPNTFNLFVQGKQSPDSLAPREKPLSSKFDHQRLTSLITSQLLTSSLLDEDGIGDRVGLITNQLVNIFDKMHRLGEREDFERVIENVDSKHSELNRSVESFEVVDKGSNPDSTIDWKSVRSHLSSVTNRKKEM
jgi:hypothetical protein